MRPVKSLNLNKKQINDEYFFLIIANTARKLLTIGSYMYYVVMDAMKMNLSHHKFNQTHIPRNLRVLALHEPLRALRKFKR